MTGLVGRTFAAALAIALGSCATVPRQDAMPAPPAAADAGRVPAAMQWLYGSGESAAGMLQTYRALVAFAVGVRPGGDSVVLAKGSPLVGGPMTPVRFEPCGGKPRAVVFDADETLLWNAGFEYWSAVTGRAYDTKVWNAWERTGRPVAMPGAIEAVARLRAAGIVPVVNTNRLAVNAAATAASLEAAGLGTFVHGRTLFLKGDDAGGSDKDGRRATIAARYCVIALVGDNLGDFSDAFNAPGLDPARRRDLAAALGIEGGISHLWGRGWFLLPNPVYGPSLAGDIDAIFPPTWRWMPAQGDE